MISPGALPTTLGFVWTGISQTPPELLAEALMSKLDDEEDSFPAYRVRTMNTDRPDSDTMPTEAAPPSEGEPTRTDNSRPALAPPALPSERMRDIAVDELLKMHRTVAEGLQELLAPEGRLAKQTEAIASAIDRAAERTNGTYELLRGELKSFRDAAQAKDADHDRQLASLHSRIERLEKQLATQQEELDEINRCLEIAGFGPTQPPTPEAG